MNSSNSQLARPLPLMEGLTKQFYEWCSRGELRFQRCSGCGTFRHVPRERLLLETDAPDQFLPDTRNRFPLADAATGKPLNHPANLAAVYAFAAELLGEPLECLAACVEENFRRLFGG